MPKTSLLPIVGNNGEKAAFIVLYNYGKMDSPFAGASFFWGELRLILPKSGKKEKKISFR